MIARGDTRTDAKYFGEASVSTLKIEREKVG